MANLRAGSIVFCFVSSKKKNQGILLNSKLGYKASQSSPQQRILLLDINLIQTSFWACENFGKTLMTEASYLKPNQLKITNKVASNANFIQLKLIDA